MAVTDRSTPRPAPQATPDAAPADERPLSVIARDVHVTYRTYGGRRNALRAPDRSLASRLLGRATKHVGAVTEIEAVRGVSFVAHHGESIGLVGRNGSGKSTFLRALAGLMPLSGGEIYASGDVALLGVNAALMNQLSGERNVMIGGLAQGLTRKEVRERFDEIVDFAGIGEFIHLPMRAYSSGMAARLRFAISSATVPDILIIDEALATGDAEFKAKSAARIEEIRSRAGTVFLVSHSAATIRRMCDRVIWLEKGKVVADGEPTEIIEQYEQFIRELRVQAAAATKPAQGGA